MKYLKGEYFGYLVGLCFFLWFFNGKLFNEKKYNTIDDIMFMTKGYYIYSNNSGIVKVITFKRTSEYVLHFKEDVKHDGLRYYFGGEGDLSIDNSRKNLVGVGYLIPIPKNENDPIHYSYCDYQKITD